MDLFALTRALVDLDSTTGNEKPVVDFLFSHLSTLAARHNGRVERLSAAPNRDNIFLSFGDPIVTLSTHMDTVPPYFSSTEDDTHIHGRGSCDAKGIIASMIHSAESLLASGTRNFALLFVVGEERDSAGATAAASSPRGSRFLINGEPTENRIALGSKGVLRYELVARGKLAHSAYPELGHSAIHSLLDALAQIRALPLPCDPVLGQSTLNVGTIHGGRAPNVVADEARAEIMFRLVAEPAELRLAVAKAAQSHKVEAREVLFNPAVRLNTLADLSTTVVAFATDIPTFNGAWGQPYLIGPGSIHVAHTAEERIPKRELTDAVGIYSQMVRRLLATGKVHA
ncbi:MAG TPA: M20/M25/M40 family metallo-hydrolase [Candidatus Saccharimonadales bacterium]|nr:M20/M25/M40 family metallo-hydrolase [Candidatus Saccharimonadales bacterium]